jgi:hypothetical protein
MGQPVDPSTLTKTIGVSPSRVFEIGEASGAFARDKAGWVWTSNLRSETLEAPLKQFAEIFGPHTQSFRNMADDGAQVSLTLHGEILTDVIKTRDEAVNRKWFVGEVVEEFEPFLDRGRVELYIDNDTIQLLGEMGALVDTYIVFILNEIDQTAPM